MYAYMRSLPEDWAAHVDDYVLLSRVPGRGPQFVTVDIDAASVSECKVETSGVEFPPGRVEPKSGSDPYWKFAKFPYEIYHLPSLKLTVVEGTYFDYLRVIAEMLERGVRCCAHVTHLPTKLRDRLVPGGYRVD